MLTNRWLDHPPARKVLADTLRRLRAIARRHNVGPLCQATRSAFRDAALRVALEAWK